MSNQVSARKVRIAVHAQGKALEETILPTLTQLIANDDVRREQVTALTERCDELGTAIEANGDVMRRQMNEVVARFIAAEKAIETEHLRISWYGSLTFFGRLCWLVRGMR